MMIWLWILIALIVLLVIIIVSYFNRFVVLENRIRNSLSQIDVQLKKRADLVPSLIKTVKGYVKHEKSIFNEINKARTSLLNSKTIASKAKAGADLQNALKSIFALAESNPEIKSNENFLHLQQELSAIEDKVAYARQHYNDSILSFNNSIQTFPGNFFASMFSKKEKEFLQIPSESKAVPKIDF